MDNALGHVDKVYVVAFTVSRMFNFCKNIYFKPDRIKLVLEANSTFTTVTD